MHITTHRFADRNHFETLKAEFGEDIEKRVRWLGEGRGNPQSIYQSLCDLAIGLGCIGLILGVEDEEARGHFVRAVEYAGKLLTAPGSTKGPRVYDVQLEASASGVRPLAIHEIPPSREPSKLSVIDYAQILYVTVAFGDQDSMARVAAVPEDTYQNANVIAPPALFGSFRAWKAWLSGSEAEARKEALAALKACTEEAGRAPLMAFVAMASRDAEGFREHLEERLRGHKKEYQKTPNRPSGVICLDGLALCRLALDRGLVVEEGPYVPTRLLPNSKPSIH